VLRLLSNQQPDGSWTLYPDQTTDLSLTTLAYFAPPGDPKQAPRMRDAERIFLNHGGLTQTSTFAKVLLAAAGQLPLSVIPVPPINLISFDPAGPVSLFDITAPVAGLSKTASKSVVFSFSKTCCHL
jgi:Squalene-hopene cyclase N-terminal domain